LASWIRIRIRKSEYGSPGPEEIFYGSTTRETRVREERWLTAGTIPKRRSPRRLVTSTSATVSSSSTSTAHTETDRLDRLRHGGSRKQIHVADEAAPMFRVLVENREQVRSFLCSVLDI
jgi:hypothetical protein